MVGVLGRWWVPLFLMSWAWDHGLYTRSLLGWSVHGILFLGCWWWVLWWLSRPRTCTGWQSCGGMWACLCKGRIARVREHSLGVCLYWGREGRMWYFWSSPFVACSRESCESSDRCMGRCSCPVMYWIVWPGLLCWMQSWNPWTGCGHMCWRTPGGSECDELLRWRCLQLTCWLSMQIDMGPWGGWWQISGDLVWCAQMIS